jgi:nitrogen fixation protein NifZ
VANPTNKEIPMPPADPHQPAHIHYAIGDLVYAAEDILNDGGMPGIEAADGLIAAAGTRGVVVRCGVAEQDETMILYLVRFESAADGVLGDPVGCLPDELTQQEQPQNSLAAGAAA